MDYAFMEDNIVGIVAFVLALIGFFFPFGALKKQSTEFRQHFFGSMLIMLTFTHISMWQPSPTTSVEGLVKLCGLLLVIASLALIGMQKPKPYLTKISLLALVVYLFLVFSN